MRIILLLGKQLLPNGEMSKEFRLQMEKAVELLRAWRGDLMVITGGVTIPGLPSEAQSAFAFVPEDLRARVRLEEKAMSTKQNIEFSKELLVCLNVDARSIIIISSPGHERRTRYLFRRLWPEVTLSFENVGTYTPRERVVHMIIFVLTVLDPEEKIFLPLKRWWLERRHPPQAILG